ncbi:hypothetical protein SAMN05192575_10798 [Nocardioides alpinus]|uniref:Uncharacterized protein n=1 Tax=Nocardioides alpinus TaxID=748909 RepID=A0A1I1A051_9ACTN|nr:hypothetical protein [Nocardioides alpinus]PKH42203.1 hypothetical protein CXG46_06935 [Nocardioides alpinus]SFB31379.1 hypothetical protein SAMN05192575_10798 [Nocardioides alpinus]
MSITWGDLRSWRAAGVTSASDLLRADIKALELARDAVESDAIPASFEGFARIAAVARQAALVATMETHLEGLTSFERTVYGQVATVTSIERAVQDVDTDAAAQQFSIDSSGTVSDVSPPRTFDNTFERNEHQDGRRRQLEALVARMTAALDDAYAVDSAIIGARPHGSFSDDGPDYVVDPEVEREWATMSDDERRAVIEHIAEEQAREAGVDDFEVRIEDLEDADGDGVDDDPDTDSRGSWSEDDRVLRIDEGNLDDPTILGTVAHEVRHAEQRKAVDDLPWWPWEDYHGPPGVSQEEVESWEDNFDDYKTSDDDGFDAYHDQPVEADARETGGGYLDDLDRDDLERIREEAR